MTIMGFYHIIRIMKCVDLDNIILRVDNNSILQDYIMLHALTTHIFYLNPHRVYILLLPYKEHLMLEWMNKVTSCA